MGKKYIIELEDSESVYKTIIANGYPMLQVIVPAPYTEPDLEQVRKEAYENGYETAKHECEDCPKQAYTDAIRMEGYQKGLSDAWEAARTLWNTPTRKEIFGYTTFSTTLTTLTAQETIEKIRQYEHEKEEIKVGDEVINQNKTAVVTEITNRYTRIMYSDGSGYALFAKGLTKTGRHFPEIAAVLEKMKES